MRILLLGIDHPLTQSLTSQLLTLSEVERVMVIATDHTAIQPSNHLTILNGDPTTNGPWLAAVRGQYNLIINATFPLSPFHPTNEADRQTKILRNLAQLDREIPLIQIVPITTYPPSSLHPFVPGTLVEDAATGWGSAYIQSLRLAQTTFTQLRTIIYGQILYDSAGIIYSTRQPHLGPFTFPIQDAQSNLTCTHIDDLISAVVTALHSSTPSTTTVIQPETLRQAEALRLFAQKTDQTYLPFAIPLPLASKILGPTISTWSASYTPPSKHPTFLQYPTLKAGLHLP